jgi:hypothetical protein
MSSTKGGKSKSGAAAVAASNAPKTVQTRSAKAGLQVRCFIFAWFTVTHTFAWWSTVVPRRSYPSLPEAAHAT